MMYSEFIKLAKVESVQEDDYAIIETVYNFHPAITAKVEIVGLYNTWGMTVIKDMLPRAKRIEAIEKSMQENKMEMENLQRHYNHECE